MSTRLQPIGFKYRLLTITAIIVWTTVIFIWHGTGIAGAVDDQKKSESATDLHKELPKIWISAPTALRQVKNHSATIVDIRDSGALGKVSIPGSLNISLHFIKTKQRLKNSFLILVGEGYGYRLALRACFALQKSRFNAKVLFGGLPAWRASGGPVEGDLTVLSQYKYIAPSAFTTDLADGLVVPISWGGKAEPKESKDMVAGVHHVAVGKNPKAMVKQLKKIAADIKKASGYKTPVIVDMVGRNIEDLEALSGKAGIENIRFLKGGLIAYRQYLSGLAKAGKPREDRLQTTGNCSPCAEKIGKQPIKE